VVKVFKFSARKILKKYLVSRNIKFAWAISNDLMIFINKLIKLIIFCFHLIYFDSIIRLNFY
jgi:hypothetical protein